MGGVETIAVSSRVSILEVIMQATINKMIQARAQHPLVHDGSGEVFLETVWSCVFSQFLHVVRLSVRRKCALCFLAGTLGIYWTCSEHTYNKVHFMSCSAAKCSHMHWLQCLSKFQKKSPLMIFFYACSAYETICTSENTKPTYMYAIMITCLHNKTEEELKGTFAIVPSMCVTLSFPWRQGE